jgi:hypothetical protein
MKRAGSAVSFIENTFFYEGRDNCLCSNLMPSPIPVIIRVKYDFFEFLLLGWEKMHDVEVWERRDIFIITSNETFIGDR